MKAVWFSGTFCIGIVKTDTGRSYIGECLGIDEIEDMRYIAQHGMPIDSYMLKEVLDFSDYDKSLLSELKLYKEMYRHEVNKREKS